ncbi:hypothetical protein GOBAR_AA10980 [Gossypium barbadense]|uniref:Uncharacterized protein n=1 Tax=Gossypium barbadense TaxID=3634 RepID=A0A2P5Y244_GOSBA|nr:hypothetical protein GOBAR_AA10980 [Gossypium barbadense]
MVAVHESNVIGRVGLNVNSKIGEPVNVGDVGQDNLELESLAHMLEVNFDKMKGLEFLEYPYITLGYTTLDNTYSGQLAIGT